MAKRTPLYYSIHNIYYMILLSYRYYSYGNQVSYSYVGESALNQEGVEVEEDLSGRRLVLNIRLEVPHG